MTASQNHRSESPSRRHHRLRPRRIDLSCALHSGDAGARSGRHRDPDAVRQAQASEHECGVLDSPEPLWSGKCRSIRGGGHAESVARAARPGG
jgi:hypothetical protein